MPSSCGASPHVQRGQRTTPPAADQRHGRVLHRPLLARIAARPDLATSKATVRATSLPSAMALRGTTRVRIFFVFPLIKHGQNTDKYKRVMEPRSVTLPLHGCGGWSRPVASGRARVRVLSTSGRGQGHRAELQRPRRCAARPNRPRCRIAPSVTPTCSAANVSAVNSGWLAPAGRSFSL